MNDFLWIPILLVGGLTVYLLLHRQAAKRAAAAPGPRVQTPGPDAVASVDIIGATFTNNSYPPMGDVLSELDKSKVKDILGDTLHADMAGYLQ